MANLLRVYVVEIYSLVHVIISSSQGAIVLQKYTFQKLVDMSWLFIFIVY